MAEANAFDRAEKGYAEVLKLTPEKDAARTDLVERQAASIYKQGEQARAAGDNKAAAENFSRVAVAAPGSAIRVNAEYDTAASLIALKDWPAAARALEAFRQRYPNHALQGDVTANLPLRTCIYARRSSWSGPHRRRRRHVA